MTKPRYILRLVTAFIFRFKYVLFFGVIIGFFIFILSGIVLPRYLLRKTTIIGVTGQYETDSLPREIAGLISEGLTKMDENGRPVSALAESWEAQEDGKKWVFKLKGGLKWQDGSAITSKTINYNFDDVIIEKPDDETIIFELESPYAPFPAVVSKPVFKRGLLGAGNWAVRSADISNNVIRSLTLLSRTSESEVLKINFYPTEERTKLAFKLGEVDRVEDLISPTPLDEWGVFELEKKTNLGQFVAIFLNNTNETFKDNKQLRQALSYATNKNPFEGVRAISPMAPYSWAFNPQVKTYDYDEERARELLDELLKDGEEISIKLSTTPALLPIAEKVISDWKRVGVNASVQVVSAIPDEYQAFLAIYDIPPDPDQYSTWHSTQAGTNISHYVSPRIDKLLEDGRVQLDIDERKKIYLDFQRFLLEDAPVIFLYHPVYYTVSRE